MFPKLFCTVISLMSTADLLLSTLLTLLKMKPMSQENQDSYISNCNTRRLYEINISKAFTLNRRELLHQHIMRCRWETLSFGDFIKWFVSRLPFSTLWVVFLPAAFFHCVLSLCMYFRAFIFIWLYDHPQSRKILKFCAWITILYILLIKRRWCWP